MFRSLRDSVENFVDKLRDFASELVGGSSVVNTDAPEPREAAPREVEPEPEPIDLDPPDDYDDDEDPEDTEWLDYLDIIREADFPESGPGGYRTFESADIQAKYLRVVRYATAEEAREFLEEAGLADFSEILYLEDEDDFTIAIYDSPGSEEA